MSNTNLHSKVRPSLRPGTPGGDCCFSRAPVSNPLSRVIDQDLHGWQEERDEEHPLRGYPEGIHMKANWYNRNASAIRKDPLVAR